MNRKLLWLVYRKLRPPLGIPFAFTIMSGVFLGVFSYDIVLIAFGFLFIDLFGNFYNDYWDYPEDMRNKRYDKLTTCGFISLKSAFWISVIFAFIGIFFLMLVNMFLLFLGLLYIFILFAYSHESVRLKGTVIGYSIVAFPLFLLPIFIANVNSISPFMALPLAFFFFSQYNYILCQKDSTDPEDKTNLFLVHGRKKSSSIVAFFAVLSSLALLSMSFMSVALLLLWAFNLFSKAYNINRIMLGTITRSLRSNLILVEFLTPYLFALGMFLW